MNTPVILILIFFSATATKSLSLQDNCNCNPNGVETEGCDASGQCHCKCDIQGLKCTECTDFHYGFPNCSTNYCGCNLKGSISVICNKTSGQCSCKPKVSGKRCDICQDGFKLYPNCIACGCDDQGSNGDICSNDGQCRCKTNVEGLTCNRCKDKFHGFPKCQACRCDEQGSVNNICNKEDGKCDCNPHVKGDLCDECADNHYDFPSCKPCRCNAKGSKNDACNVQSGDCDCHPNVGGQKCDQCQHHYFGYPDCKECKCFPIGTKANTTCSNTGECICNPGYVGGKCDTCDKGYFKLRNGVCKECKCNLTGSVDDTCDANGDCSCKNRLINGSKCDQCVAAYFGFPNCQSCGCNARGVEKGNMNCDDRGRCNCKCDVVGDKCNACEVGHQGFPDCHEIASLRFLACNCSIAGSLGATCTPSGKCTCKKGYFGDKCDRCQSDFYKDLSGACLIGTKILIVSGSPDTDGRNMEILDVENSSFSCKRLPPFPIKLRDATGALIGGETPFICGGYDSTYNRYSPYCYKLSQAGSWTQDPTARPRTPRRWAGYGSVILNNHMVLSGGYGSSGHLRSIELLTPGARSRTLSVQLPTGIRLHCHVPWDSETFMLIGGESGSNRYQTYLINVKSNRYRTGPRLIDDRDDLACAELQVLERTYIVVTGGDDGKGTRSTEVLDKSNIGQGWQRGPNMMVGKYHHQMVSSPDKKVLYALGGANDKKGIYKLTCSGAINTCRWTKTRTSLKYGRQDFVAIPIPNTLANKLCN